MGNGEIGDLGDLLSFDDRLPRCGSHRSNEKHPRREANQLAEKPAVSGCDLAEAADVLNDVWYDHGVILRLAARPHHPPNGRSFRRT
jgi:hypothetical protein